MSTWTISCRFQGFPARKMGIPKNSGWFISGRNPIKIEVSQNGGTPKWMVYNGKSHFWDTSIYHLHSRLIGTFTLSYTAPNTETETGDLEMILGSVDTFQLRLFGALGIWKWMMILGVALFQETPSSGWRLVLPTSCVESMDFP